MLGGEVGHPDRPVGGGRDGTAPDHIHPAPVQVDVVAVPGNRARLRQLEPDEPALHPFELLQLERGETGEVPPPAELPDPADTGPEPRDPAVDALPVPPAAGPAQPRAPWR